MDPIQKIYDLLYQIFYLRYEFWFALVNFIFLIVTAIIAGKNSKTTKKIQFETLKQRILEDAKDATFQMRRNYNHAPKNESGEQRQFTFGTLTTPLGNTVIAKFTFLDANFHSIGKTTLFFKNDQALEGWIQYSAAEVGKIKGTLIEKNGLIQAKVIASSGSEFIYTYHAFSENWKEQDGNNVDDFVLVLKEIDPDFLKKLQTKP